VRVVDELTDEELLKLEEAERENETAVKEEEEEQQAVEEAPLAVRRYGAVVRTVRELLAGRSVDFDRLTALHEDEREALAILRDVISGRRNAQFTYAEDRLLALNETLARLAPILAIASVAGASELRDSFDKVRTDLTALKVHLSGLEAAEEQLFFGEAEKKAEEEDDDDEGDEGDEGDGSDGGDGGAGAAGAGAASEGTAGGGDPSAAGTKPRKPKKKKPAAPVTDAADATDATDAAGNAGEPPAGDGGADA
jgi:hypothetical protein